MGNFLKPLAAINLPKSPHILRQGVKNLSFFSEIIFGQLLETFGNLFLVTLWISQEIERVKLAKSKLTLATHFRSFLKRNCKGKIFRILTLPNVLNLSIWEKSTKHWNVHQTSGQSYKHFMLVNYNSRVVIWGIFQSGATLEL